MLKIFRKIQSWWNKRISSETQQWARQKLPAKNSLGNDPPGKLKGQKSIWRAFESAKRRKEIYNNELVAGGASKHVPEKRKIVGGDTSGHFWHSSKKWKNALPDQNPVRPENIIEITKTNPKTTTVRNGPSKLARIAKTCGKRFS